MSLLGIVSLKIKRINIMKNTNITSNSPSTKKELIVIIGNAFGAFAEKHLPSITFSKFENELEKLTIAPENHTTFIPGQGLHDDQLQRIEDWLSKNNRLLTKFPKRANRWLTHKHEPKNILISDFIKLSPTTFRCELMIDDRNELLSDHVSCHISGMTEIELFRQSFLAVTEQFYIPHGDSSSRVFVTLSKRIEFKKFLFPLPAHVEFNMLEASPNGRFKAKILLNQAGETVGEAHIEYCVMPKERLSKKEADQASSITNFFIDPAPIQKLNDQTLWRCTKCDTEAQGFFIRNCSWCGHDMVPVCSQCENVLDSNGQCRNH